MPITLSMYVHFMQNILKVKFTTLLLNQNRLWQRDKRDKPLIQPDLTYYNEVCCIDAHSSCHFSSILQLDLPCGVQESPVYSVTTKFVRASANKTRCPIYCISVRMLQCILILSMWIVILSVVYTSLCSGSLMDVDSSLVLLAENSHSGMEST